MKIWKFLPAELAHQLAPWGLAAYSSIWGNPTPIWREFKWRGIYFPNRLGLAGGVDKNARQFLDWQDVGAGFVEIGTVTPQQQSANSGKILDRDWAQKIVWNKMGFPNLGSDVVLDNILSRKNELQIPLFVNIGKNRQTENENALNEYSQLAQKFSSCADVIVVNISSPNTQGLRQLQSQQFLSQLVSAVVRSAGSTPVLIKLSPDLTTSELESSLDSALTAGALGFILTNTTLSRPNGSPFPEQGGLSGQFLAENSKKILKQAVNFLGNAKKDILLVSVGGIMTPADVEERLQMGADLVQVYSTLIFNGPGFFQNAAVYFKSLKGTAHE
jgi:dihydroorotate dehydrogenase